jgi:hypothetical protein
MPKKTKSKKTKARSNYNNTLKNAIRIVIDNSKKSVRVNSTKPKTFSQPTIIKSYSQNLSNLERSIYENEIARLNRNSLSSFVKPYNTRPTGTTLNMLNTSTQTLPDPQLSPATMTNVGLERMRQYLIDNITRIPTSKSYTVEEIEKLQPNRISQMYADTRQNILNAPQTPSQSSSRFFGSGLFGGSSKK